MSETTMSAEAKQRVRDEWVARARAAVKTWSEPVQDESDGARLDPDSSYDIDEVWQADTDGDLAGIFAEQGSAQRLDLDRLLRIDFSLKDAVAPGAIVGIDGQRNVVGIPGEPFDVDGHTYETISVDAPLYSAIAGLKLGDSYTFRGQTHEIEFLA